MSVLRVLSRNGDDETLWVADDAKATAAAEEIFRQKIKGGYIAFSIDGEGTANKIKSFDPKAEEVIMVRQFVGG